ncbi:virginiamycin B lyase family protein [Nonomuraea harbinensis]|uniref:virginiamycin B lyase family protein n=1 Tax=Nonomuraea harbinensis TaxID=1286938 RepID=UPI003FD6C7B2
MVTGPDGALWFTEWAANRLGRITVDGAISEFELPGSEPHGLATGPDGAIWVAMESGGLARVMPDRLAGRFVVD